MLSSELLDQLKEKVVTLKESLGVEECLQQVGQAPRQAVGPEAWPHPHPQARTQNRPLRSSTASAFRQPPNLRTEGLAERPTRLVGNTTYVQTVRKFEIPKFADFGKNKATKTRRTNS